MLCFLAVLVTVLTAIIAAPRSCITCARAPVVRQGAIAVFEGTTKLGYLANYLSSSSRFGEVVSDREYALIATFTTTTTNPTRLSISTTASSDYPYLCGVINPSSAIPNLKPAVSTYAILTACQNPGVGGGTATTNPNAWAGSSTSFKAEAAIWSFNTSTNKIAPQWINTDFTAPTTHIVFKPSEGMIYLTANPGSISGTTKIVTLALEV